MCPAGEPSADAEEVGNVDFPFFAADDLDGICHGFGIRTTTAALLTAVVSAKAPFYCVGRAYFSNYRSNCRLSLLTQRHR